MKKAQEGYRHCVFFIISAEYLNPYDMAFTGLNRSSLFVSLSSFLKLYFMRFAYEKEKINYVIVFVNQPWHIDLDRGWSHSYFLTN